MARKPKVINLAVWTGRLLLAGTFGYAGALKLLDPATFVADIEHYRLLPYPLAVAWALLLPWLELTCAVGVLINHSSRGALVLILALCLVFAVALGSAWIRGLDISCGCFGHGDAPATISTALLRDGALIVVTLLLISHERARLQAKTGS